MSISATTPVPDWSSAPLEGLIDHIVGAHHVYLRQALPRLTALTAEAVKHSEALIQLQSVLLDLRGELESHMWKEEMVLFPLVRTLLAAEKTGVKPPPAHCGSVNNPIRVMEHEHAAATAALDEMRRLTGDYAIPGGASESHSALLGGLLELEADLKTHIHLENDILFPRAAALESRVA